MSDKKVERNVRSSDTERPATPTQKLEAARSKEGTFNMADTAHDKGKSALLDRFRQREERYRVEQALHAKEEAGLESSIGPKPEASQAPARPSERETP
jgi:hypothetical protein